MAEAKNSGADKLRGALRLVLDATEGVAGVVESMQRGIASGPETLGRPLQGPVDLLVRERAPRRARD